MHATNAESESGNATANYLARPASDTNTHVNMNTAKHPESVLLRIHRCRQGPQVIRQQQPPNISLPMPLFQREGLNNRRAFSTEDQQGFLAMLHLFPRLGLWDWGSDCPNLHVSIHLGTIPGFEKSQRMPHRFDSHSFFPGTKRETASTYLRL